MFDGLQHEKSTCIAVVRARRRLRAIGLYAGFFAAREAERSRGVEADAHRLARGATRDYCAADTLLTRAPLPVQGSQPETANQPW